MGKHFTNHDKKVRESENMIIYKDWLINYNKPISYLSNKYDKTATYISNLLTKNIKAHGYYPK